MTNKVELIPLAITDLSLKYARHMGGNKIRHYRVSAFASILGDDVTPAQRVIDFIKAAEPESEVVVVEDILSQMVSKNRKKEDISTISPEDVTNKVLKSDSQVLKDLNKVKTKGLLYQSLRFVTFSEFAKSVSKRSVGSKLLEYVKYFFYKFVDPENSPDSLVFRTVDPVRYLAYTYEEKDEKKAFNALASDLRILSKRGLIKGHLSMPSTIYLADLVGSGQLTKTVFCFIIVDHDKLARQTNYGIIDLPRKPLSLVGVNGEVNEGELGPHISPFEYDIEEVEVPLSYSEMGRDAVVKNYLETRDVVNQSAKNAKDRMENLEVEKTSKNVFMVEGVSDERNKVEQVVVDFNLKKKK